MMTKTRRTPSRETAVLVAVALGLSAVVLLLAAGTSIATAAIAVALILCAFEVVRASRVPKRRRTVSLPETASVG